MSWRSGILHIKQLRLAKTLSTCFFIFNNNYYKNPVSFSNVYFPAQNVIFLSRNTLLFTRNSDISMPLEQFCFNKEKTFA